MAEENQNTLDQTKQQIQSGANTARSAVDTAKDIKRAAEGMKKAKNAGKAAEGAKAAASAAKATAAGASTAKATAAAAATGNWVAAAASVVVNTKVGRVVLGVVIGLMLLIPIVLAMLPNVIFSALNQLSNDMRIIHEMAEQEAAITSTSSADFYFNEFFTEVGLIYDYITNDNDELKAALGTSDLKVEYDEDSAVDDIMKKLVGTRNRYQARTDELKQGLESISDSEIADLCMAQSPDMNWDFSAGNSTVSKTVVAPPRLSDGSALMLISAFGAQTTGESGYVTINDYLSWLGLKDSTAASPSGCIAPPWVGTYMPQPLYEEMLIRKKEVLGEYYAYGSAFWNDVAAPTTGQDAVDPGSWVMNDILRQQKLRDLGLTEEDIEAAEEIEQDYEKYRTAFINYAIVVEDPVVTTWEETRTRIERQTQYHLEYELNEEGNYEWEWVEEEVDVEVEYSVGCGMVTYKIQYLSTNQLCDMLGFWPNGIGADKDKNNGEREWRIADAQQASDGAYTGEVTEDAASVYAYLRYQMGLNPAAACAVMANLDAESHFNPHAVGDNGTSYGICQWHLGRKTRLEEYCNGNGLDYTTMEGQLAYLEYELKTVYTGTWNTLTSVENSAQGAYEGAHYMCLHFEVPQDAESTSVRRGNTARDTFWPQYGQNDSPTLTQPGTSTTTSPGTSSSSSGSNGDFWFDHPARPGNFRWVAEKDPNYFGHKQTNITQAEKGAIIATINGEEGADQDGAILIAQVLRDTYDYYDFKTERGWSEVTWQRLISSNSFSSYYWNQGSRWSEAEMRAHTYAYQAYQYVFEQGNSAIQHRIMAEADTGHDFGLPWWHRIAFFDPIFGFDTYVWDSDVFGNYRNPNSTFDQVPNRKIDDVIETAYENMSGGTYGIAYQPLDGNSQTYAINYSDVVECGDWINLFVAGAYYDKLVNEEWPEDLTVEVYQMITENNVDARMKIIDSIGLDAVNEFAYNNSCSDTQINNSSLAAGSPDTTSIKDMARMLRKIQDKTFVNEEVSNTILTMLENHTANDIFGRDLPSGVKVCEITSKGSSYVGSAALIYEEDKCYLLCMFGANVSDVDQAESRFASLAKDIYDFNHQLQGATNNGAGGLMNVEFSKTYFEDHPFYFSDRFNYIDEESNILYWMKKATKYGRDQDYMLQYSWNAYSKVIERTTAFEDDIYFDLIENSAEYANITLDTSNGLGGANGSYGDGSSLAQVAEQEYQNYGGTACGNRYWPSGPEAWCVDFVYWCAQQCGYVGSGQIFGTFVHNVSDEAINLQNAGATIYYPGDGTIPQPGDIIMFWDDKGRPGTAADGVPVNQGLLCHTGIVVEGTSSTVTIVEGNCGSSNPANSVLKKNTYSLTGASWGNTYICCFARPNYPTRVFDTSSRAAIQNALITLLYNGQSGGVVTCDFDGYVNTPGRHEGIDIARGAGSPIYSVMSGEIIGVNRGSDSGLLSTIFVYDATRNKTVCYMHCAPRSDLYVGNRIAVGDSLGTEASRGAGGAHTHIEVINGRSLYAMKSVNDYVLENEDPYPYWASVLGGR